MLLEENPRSPGMKYRHYAPNAMVYVLEDKAAAVQAISECNKLHVEVGFIISTETKKFLLKEISTISGTNTLKTFSSISDFGLILFRELRNMDRAGINIIFIEKISESGIGLAIMDRVQAASSKVFKASSQIQLKQGSFNITS